TGAGKRIKRPAFGTVLSVCCCFARQDFAFSAIEAREMTASGERGPNDAVLVDVDATRKETLFCRFWIIERWFVSFSNAGSPLHANDLSWCSRHRAPYDSVVGRVGNNAVNSVHLHGLVRWDRPFHLRRCRNSRGTI